MAKVTITPTKMVVAILLVVIIAAASGGADADSDGEVDVDSFGGEDCDTFAVPTISAVTELLAHVYADVLARNVISAHLNSES